MIDTEDASFQELVVAMKRDPPPLALLGAGASIDSGYPSWSQLLALLAERARERSPISPKYQETLKLLNDPAWQAEEYRRLMGEAEFCEFIQSAFGPPKGEVGETSAPSSGSASGTS